MPDAAAVPARRETLGAALRRATAQLRGAGIEDAGGDARRLLGAALGLSAAELLARPERELSAEECARLDRSVARRRGREPVSRILGERDFYGRSFAISPATLDPRPDSETLIEATLEIVAGEGWRTKPLRLVDVGTGSGCLLLTLLAELPLALGVGTDISAPALDVARANACRLGVANRAIWLERDALEDVDGPFDMLISNPPYVRSSDIAGLASEVRCFDPRPALDGGDDGLHFFRRLSGKATRVVPDGWIVFEVGHDQADAVAAVLQSSIPGLPEGAVAMRRDVTGVRRCVAARTRKLSICGESPWILSPSGIG